MKIAILTQPLNANYGGVLQNWALQFVLRQLGHEPVTIDYIHRYNRFDWLKASIKTLVLYPFPKYRRRFLPFPQWRRISKVIEPFILKRINLTHSVDHYSAELLEQYKPDAIVVGSDQVWRPMYNTGVLADMYLRFAKNYSCPKVAYAASFGTDVWEYTIGQENECKLLVQQFTSVSTREESGAKLCREHFGIEAIQTLDPTLLVPKEVYEDLCMNVPHADKPYLAAYVLSDSEDVDEIIERKAKEMNLEIHRFTADFSCTLSVEKWLAMIRDASYVVTNSFHGTVFSIIFGIPFHAVVNKERGTSRFDDLLSKYRAGKLDEWRNKSLQFLKDSLK